jgi:hypothetical protein
MIMCHRHANDIFVSLQIRLTVVVNGRASPVTPLRY